jgi:hypothetical protein
MLAFEAYANGDKMAAECDFELAEGKLVRLRAGSTYLSGWLKHYSTTSIRKFTLYCREGPIDGLSRYVAVRHRYGPTGIHLHPTFNLAEMRGKLPSWQPARGKTPYSGYFD